MIEILLALLLQQTPQPQAQFDKLCAAQAVELSFDDGNVKIALKLDDAERLVRDPDAKIGAAPVIIHRIPIKAITSEDVRREAMRVLSDREAKLRALAAALNPMPNWPQFVMNNDASVCNRNSKPLPVVKLK